MLSIFLFVISIQNLNALICYSNGTFHFSRNEFHWKDLSNILHRIEYKTLSNTSSCYVKIIVDYNNHERNYVTMTFDSTMNRFIEFGSTINIIPNEIQSIVSYLDYTCSSEDLCDKKFVEKWSMELLNAQNNSLHTSFISLWKNSSICPSDNCKSYLCFMIYDELKNLQFENSYCYDKKSTIPINIHIKTLGDYSYDYKCIKNHCTNELTYNSILGNHSIEKSTRDSNKINENNVILIRAIIIIGILVFIGSIAYYIQCKKYKQDYQLTRNA